VIALGGNALLRRGKPLTAENQRRHVKAAAHALAPIAREPDLVISHGNGPQVGLLALQGAAYRSDEAYPLDIVDAETEGMIGYLVEQELANALPDDRRFATLLTHIEVDPGDPAFRYPTKPIGPVHEAAEARKLAEARGWVIAPESGIIAGQSWSPRDRSDLTWSHPRVQFLPLAPWGPRWRRPPSSCRPPPVARGYRPARRCLGHPEGRGRDGGRPGHVPYYPVGVRREPSNVGASG
jgi:hypothetical protein